MNCPKCEKPINGNEKYCSKCGTQLFKKCIKCGNELTLDEQFCPRCGTENSEATIGERNKKKAKIKKTKKIVLICVSVLILVFLILQGISIIRTISHFKEIEPVPVIYCDGTDERTGMLHYRSALMYPIIDGLDYRICLVNLTGWSTPAEEIRDRIENAVEKEAIDFTYSTADNNLLFKDRIKTLDADLRHYPELYSVYEDRIKFIRFGWFWDPEDGEITLKSGHKLKWFWTQPLPFYFEGTVFIDGKEYDP